MLQGTPGIRVIAVERREKKLHVLRVGRRCNARAAPSNTRNGFGVVQYLRRGMGSARLGIVGHTLGGFDYWVYDSTNERKTEWRHQHLHAVSNSQYIL